MKIAVFHNFPAGGGKRTVYEQVKGLLNLGHTVSVYQLDGPGTSFCDLSTLGCQIETLHFTKTNNLPGIFNRLWADYKNFVSLDKLHKQIAARINHRFEVALIHPDLYTESPFILKHLTLPHVYFCHELLRIGYEKELVFSEKVPWPKRWYELLTRKYRVYLDRQNARSSRHIITNSRFIQKKIKAAYGRDSTICYLGVDTKVFRQSAPKNRSVIYMGQRNFVGGYDFILQIQKLIPKITIQNFGFPGGQPDTKNDKLLASSYSKAIATLCVSYNEPFGLKALESMACGTPVLAVAEGGYPESVVHNVTGWLLPRDPKMFAQKIKLLSANSKLLAKMSKASRHHVQKNWTWKKHVIQLNQLLTSVNND